MADSAPTPPPPAAPVAPPAPAKSGNRTLIVVLCILGGLLLLIGGCVTTCVYYGAKKAKEYAQTAEKNPAYATVSLLASLSPDVDVVSKDAVSGKITLRNKKSGESITLDTHDYTPENIGRALEEFARGLPATKGQAGETAPAPAQDETKETVTITLAKDGSLEFNGETATMESLPELVRQAGKDAAVLIIAEENTPLPTVTRVMDTCRKAGLSNIRLQSR